MAYALCWSCRCLFFVSLFFLLFSMKRRLSFNTKSFNVIQTPIFIERKSNKFENAIDIIEFSVSNATSNKYSGCGYNVDDASRSFASLFTKCSIQFFWLFIRVSFSVNFDFGVFFCLSPPMDDRDGIC